MCPVYGILIPAYSLNRPLSNNNFRPFDSLFSLRVKIASVDLFEVAIFTVHDFWAIGSACRP